MTKRSLLVLLLVAALVLPGCGSGGGGDTTVPTVPSGGGGTGTGGTTPPPSTAPGDLGALDDTGDLLGSSGDNWYFTKAAGINSAGQIVGQSNNGSPVKGAFLWTPGTGAMNFLGMHVGAYDDYYGLKSIPSLKFFIYSEAVAINDSGIVIGNTTTGTGWPNEAEKRAFAWDSTRGFMDLAPPPYFDTTGKLVSKPFSEVADINNLGNVVLTAEDATGRHAYYWGGTNFALATFEREDTSTVDALVPVLQPLGGIINADAEAVAINESRQAVINSGGTAVFHDLVVNVIESLNHLPGATGTAAVDINNQGAGRGHIVGNSGNHGFFWDGGSMYPIDTLGGASSEAVDLNDQDQVVGNAETADGSTHAFLWRLGADGRGVITDLGTLGGANSYATAINDAGQVVGYSETGETYSEGGVTVNIVHAFLWANGVMYDLGTHNDFYTFPFIPPYPFSEAVAINNGGDVAGNSYTINAHYRGFYLSPTFP